MGFSLENIVFFELLRRGYKVNIGKVGSTEVDFVAEKDSRLHYYQVTASLTDETTFQREITPLKTSRTIIRKRSSRSAVSLSGIMTGSRWRMQWIGRWGSGENQESSIGLNGSRCCFWLSSQMLCSNLVLFLLVRSKKLDLAQSTNLENKGLKIRCSYDIIIQIT